MDKILDIRVGHVLKFLIAAFSTAYVWVMLAAGQLFMEVAIFGVPKDNNILGTGIPLIERAALGFIYLVPAMIVSLFPASVIWHHFYGNKD